MILDAAWEVLVERGYPDFTFEAIVDRAVARGELPDLLRSTRLVNLPFDLYRHDGIMTMRPVTDEAIREIVVDVWIPLLKLP